ncbi:MAG: HAD-IIIA family hydrolase [Anaerolineae bacterium]|nr:HAD-IIIA family hydrolase [Anaerolineae bacterium]
MKHPPEAIVFDFDYTLADSSKGVVECINFALSSLSLPTVSAQQACRTIGLSLPHTFERLTGKEETTLSDEFGRLFKVRADKIMVNSTVLLAPVPQTVKFLKQHGIKLGIVSTKFRRRIETILAREGLSGFFDVIVGGEDVIKHKPDPEGLNLALNRLRCSPADSLYVGDSLTDAETASRVGIPFVAVLSGTTGKEEFRGYNVTKFLENLGDLTKWVDFNR